MRPEPAESRPGGEAPILKGVLTLSARGVAYEVVRRVFEEDAYADRAFRALAEGLSPEEYLRGLI